jgi:hypothetical protein
MVSEYFDQMILKYVYWGVEGKLGGDMRRITTFVGGVRNKKWVEYYV